MRPGFILTSELLAAITSAEGTVAYDHANNSAAAHQFYAPQRAYVFDVGRVLNGARETAIAAVALNGMRVTEFKVFRGEAAKDEAARYLTTRIELEGFVPFHQTAAFAPLTEAQTAAAGRRF